MPKDWATSEAIESYDVVSTSELLYPGSKSIAVDESGEHAVVGGVDGVAGIYSLPDNKILAVLKVGTGAITDTVWYGSSPVIATSSGTIKVFTDGNESAVFTSHAGAANALAMHPTGEILASVGADKSFVFYDLIGSKQVMQVNTDSGTYYVTLERAYLIFQPELTTASFHPDGHLFAAGGTDGHVKLYHVKSGEFAASFDCGAPVQSVSFSENGIWFSAATKGSTTVITFDLRKENAAAVVKAIDLGSRVDSVAWDYTGQYLATGGPGGVTVQQYTKASKQWAEPKRSAIPATAVAWGSKAQSLVAVNGDGVITVLGSK